MTTYSKHAQELLKTLQEGLHVIDFYEYLSHDGYDAEGAKSNLWDLYVVVRTDHGFGYYTYHAEDWFSDDGEVSYSLHDYYQSRILLVLSQKETLYELDYDGGIDFDYAGLSRDHEARRDLILKLEVARQQGVASSDLREVLKDDLRPSVLGELTIEVATD